MASKTKDTGSKSTGAKGRGSGKSSLGSLGSLGSRPTTAAPVSPPVTAGRNGADAPPALPHRAAGPTAVPAANGGIPRATSAGIPSSAPLGGGIPRTGASPVGGTSANLQDSLIPLENIAPDPNQPRKLNLDDVAGLALFDQGVAEMATSIEQHGLIEAIEVRPAPAGTLGLDGQPVEFILVVGERRYRAHRRLNQAQPGGKYAKIRAKVQMGLTADQAYLRQVAENADRESLTPMQRAREMNVLRGVLARQEGYANKEGRAEFDWQDMASRIRGEGRNAINTYSRLASLPEAAQLMLLNHSVPEASKIVKAIVRLKVGEDDEKIIEALRTLMTNTAASVSTSDEAAKLRTQAAREAKAAKVKGEVVFERDIAKMGVRPGYSIKVVGLFPKEGDAKVKGRAVSTRPSAELAILKHLLTEIEAEVGHRERTPLSAAVPAPKSK